MTKMSMRCCVCSEVAQTEEDLRVHITVRHVRYIPLECHHCDHVFLPTLHALTRHNRMVHSNKLPVAVATISYDAEKATEVEKLVAQSQSNTDNVMSVAEPTPKRKRQPQTQCLEEELKLPKKAEKFINKTQQNSLRDDEAGTGESSQTNVGEPKEDNGPNQLHFWFDRKKKFTNGLQEEDQNNSLIERETENEMSSLMETANDISNDHYDQQEEGEKNDEINQNASTFASETEENGTKDDEDQLKLFIAEELNTSEEQQRQPLNTDNDELRKSQNTSEIELSDNESEKDNSIFAFSPREENVDDRASSPLITNTSLPALSPARKIGKTNELTEKNQNNSLIKGESNECHDLGDAEQDDENNENSSTLESVAEETTDDEDQALDLKLRIGEESVTLEEQSEQPLNQDKSGLVNSQNTTETELSDNESEIDNSLFAFAPGKGDGDDRTSSPLITHTSSPAMNPSFSLLFGEGTGVFVSKRRPGRKPFVSKDCALCGKTSFEKSDQRERHIWSVHMPMERFGCRLCPRIRMSRSEAIQNHIHRYHAGDESVIEDAKMEVLDLYNATRQEAFPNLMRRRMKLASIISFESGAEEAEGKDDKRAPALPTEAVDQLNDCASDQAPVSSSSSTSTDQFLSTSRRRTGPIGISKDCALCGKTSIRKWDQRDHHIWSVHMRTHRFHCRLCPLIKMTSLGKVQKHVQDYHQGEMDVIEDAKSKLKEQYKAIRLKAFPALVPQNIAPVVKYYKRRPQRCQLCRKMIKSKGQHIWGHHVQARRYKCSICSYKAAHTAMIKVHMLAKHPERTNAYIDRYQALLPEFEESHYMAFDNAIAPKTPKATQQYQKTAR